MNKTTLGQLAILGITTGLIANIGLYADVAAYDADQTIAKLKKKSSSEAGCKSLTAMRDTPKKSGFSQKIADKDEDKDVDDEDSDKSDDEEADESDEKKDDEKKKGAVKKTW